MYNGNNRKLGVLELIVSVLLLLAGIATLARPSTSLTAAAVIYGLLALITGILDVVFYVKLERRTGFGPVISLVTGILGIIAGLMFLFEPVAGALALAWIFPIWMLCHCISRLSHLGFIRVTAGSAYYYFSMVVNILGIIAGVFMIFNPLLSVLSMAWIVSFYLILLGIDGIVLSIWTLARR